MVRFTLIRIEASKIETYSLRNQIPVNTKDLAQAAM